MLAGLLSVIEHRQRCVPTQRTDHKRLASVMASNMLEVAHAAFGDERALEAPKIISCGGGTDTARQNGTAMRHHVTRTGIQACKTVNSHCSWDWGQLCAWRGGSSESDCPVVISGSVLLQGNGIT